MYIITTMEWNFGLSWIQRKVRKGLRLLSNIVIMKEIKRKVCENILRTVLQVEGAL